nr:MAG TPA: hypothetical protein [Caudoviricetes sp.]
MGISDNTNFFSDLNKSNSEMLFLEERECCFNLILPIHNYFMLQI